MRTIGRRWSSSAPRGDYPAYCSYCGVPWPRSKLKRDAAGLWACPDDQAGRDVVTLDRGNAMGARRLGRMQRPMDAPPFPGNTETVFVGSEDGVGVMSERGDALVAY